MTSSPHTHIYCRPGLGSHCVHQADLRAIGCDLDWHQCELLLLPRFFCVLVEIGRVTEEEGLTDETCSGLCAQGHYCRPGSVSAFQDACPAGRFGAFRGLKDSFCAEVRREGRVTPDLQKYVVCCGVDLVAFGMQGSYLFIGLKRRLKYGISSATELREEWRSSAGVDVAV